MRFLRDGDSALAGPPPPIAFAPSEAEIAAIETGGACHATDFGPSSQDKLCNEDFALSAVLEGADGQEFAFAAVADGVSNGSFFAERGARLACFAALRSVAEELSLGADPSDEAARASFRISLHGGVVAMLEAEIALLREIDAVPIGWATDTFAKYRGETERWFRTTLLVAVIGPRGGFVSVTGDGGVRGFLRETGQPDALVERTLLSSGGGPIERCVSLRLQPEDLSFASISTAGRDAVHVVLASDGLDLSLGRIGQAHWRDLPLETSKDAVPFLSALAQDPRAEADNLSVARASWPLREPRLAWGSWSRAPLEGWLGTGGRR